MDTSWLEGDGWLALAAVGLFGVVALVEHQALRRGWAWYFALALPLRSELVPLPAAPTGRGRAEGVQWAVGDAGETVRWWTDPEDRRRLRGLHGRVDLAVDRRGQVHLGVRWAPWWTPFVACGWLVGVGLLRGDGLDRGVALGTGLALGAILAVLYQAAAERAAGLLRWSLLRGAEDDARP